MKKNNIQHTWSLVCTQSSIDNESNNVSIHNVIEKVTFNIPKSEFAKAQEAKAQGILLAHQFEILTHFHRKDVSEPEIFFYRVSMVNPKGVTMITNEEMEVRFAQNTKNVRIRSRFNSLPIEEPGDYGFKIEVKSDKEEELKTVYTVPIELALNIE